MKMCIVSSRSRVWQFYYRRWQVVLCFSPVGSTLRVRSRKFPAVTNCTAIDWFHEWPQEALVSVSKRFIDDLEQLEVRRIFFTNFYIRELLSEAMIMIWMDSVGSKQCPFCQRSHVSVSSLLPLPVWMVYFVYSSWLENLVSTHCLTTVQIELTIARSTIPKENEGPLG